MTDMYNIEVEQQLLGSILLNNDLPARFDLDAAWFFDPVHRHLFEVISARITEDQLASPVTIKPLVQDHPGLKELGGPAYLARLAGVSIAPAFKDYAQQLRDLWARRTLSEALRSGADEIERFEIGDSPSATIGRIEAEIASVASVASKKPLVKSWASATNSSIMQIADAYQNDGMAGTPTGIAALDKQIGGMKPGDMIVLAGRPSMGKTALALGLAWSVAEQGIPVFFGSLEMTAEALLPRFFSNKLAQRGVEIPYFNIANGRMNETEFRDVIKIGQEFADLPIQIGERECRSMPRLRSAARRSEKIFGKPPGLIVIDYLQLIEDPKATSDYNRVSKASGDVKSLAMDMGCPVLVLSQLNRGVEAREPPIPRLSDLRDSGKVEEDADIIMLAYRETYYLSKLRESIPVSDLQRHADLADAIRRCGDAVSLFIPKMRGGATGKVDLEYRPAFNLVGSPIGPWEA